MLKQMGKDGIEIAAALKYLSNFWGPLEMPLINCKVELSLKWIEHWTTAANAINSAFKITDAKLYVPVLTLSTEDNVKLAKQLSEGFKRSSYWNKSKVIDDKVVEITDANMKKSIRELLDSSYQGVKRLFLLSYDNKAGNNQVSADSFEKFLSESKNWRIPTLKLMEEICMISQLMTQLNNTTKSGNNQQDKVMIIQLVVYWILRISKKNYRLIVADLSKQKARDADSIATPEIKTPVFTGKITAAVANTRLIIYYIFEQPKETILQFSKGTTKVL